MMIRCIAIDDEPLALAQISRYIGRVESLELVGAFYSVQQARAVIESEKVDLLFLDIEMPDINGVDFARSLGDKCPYIIFTTAYPQFAVDGFRLDAVDYLLKPLSMEELEKAVEKVKRRQKSASQPVREQELFVKVSGSVRRIAIADILYIKGLSEYVQIWIRGLDSPLTSFGALKHFEEQLADGSFMRVHKSYIINLKAVDSATRSSVKIGSVSIPVGEKYRTDFIKYLKTELEQ